MAIKGFQTLMAEANTVIPSITSDDAKALHENGEAVFVDVREQHEIQQARIPGSTAAPRGFLEFVADPAAPNHNPALSSGKQLVVYCASGGRSLLAAMTLRAMGYEDVVNLAGGIQGWAQGGGPLEQ